MGITIQQLSVFLENREGRLDEVLSVLAGNDINIVALSLADTSEYENNYTKFIIVANKKIFELRANKISISFEVPHESGSLYHKLSHFIYNGINMNKIESRPVQGKAWEYRFFVDIEGNLNDAAVQNALRGLTEETIRLKILGNYVSAEGNE